jgi:AraC-like DNA-binding protein
MGKWRNGWERRPRSILFFWILSYFIVLLIMFFTFSTTYTRSLAMLENQAARLSDHALQNVQSDIDNKLSEKDAIFQGIILNPHFSKLLEAGTPGEQRQWMLYQLWNNLKTIMSPYDPFFSCFISFPHLNVAVSYDNSVPYQTLYEGTMLDLGLSYDTYAALMTGSYSNTYLLLPPEEPGGRSIICFAHTVQFDKADGHSANVLFFFFADELIAGLHPFTGVTEGSSLILAEPSDALLVFGGELSVETAWLNAFAEEGRMAVTTLNGARVGVSMRASRVSPLRYYMVAPYEVIFQQVAFIQRFGLVGITLGTCLSLGLIVLSLRKNYTPIRRLMGSVRPFTTERADQNELDIIQSAIEGLAHLNGEQMDLIDAQTRLLDENALRERLLGQRGATLSEAGARALKARYQLVLIACEDASDSEGDGSQPIGAMRAAQLLADAHPPCAYLSLLRAENLLALVFSAEPAEDAAWADALENLAALLEQRYDLITYIAVSGARHDFENIAYTYALLKDHIAYNRRVGDTSVLYLPQARQAFARRYTYPEQMENRLSNLVQLGDAENAAALVRELLDYNLTQGMVSLEAARGLAFAVLGTMIQAVEPECPADVEALIQEMNPYGRLAGCTDAAGFKRKLEAFCRAFCGLTAQSRKGSSREGSALVERVNRYVAEHMASPTLSLATIAAHFGLTAPYLSTLYSNATGLRLVDSINSLRVEEVKRLLTGQSLSIERIAERTGFSGAKTLTRVFKKYEGITPGQYRELSEKSRQ